MKKIIDKCFYLDVNFNTFKVIKCEINNKVVLVVEINIPNNPLRRSKTQHR